MDKISGFLVRQPLHILGVAGIYFLIWAGLRFGTHWGAHHVNAILAPTICWVAYAAWEWLVLVKIPEANIRVDLMIIWPLLIILTTWAAVRILRASLDGGETTSG